MDEFRSNFENPFHRLNVNKKTSVNIAVEIAEVVTKKIDGDYLPNMLKIITKDQSKRFIKKIFHNNKTRYIKFIRLIDRTSCWKAANAEILKLYSKISVDYYSKEALEFSDCVYLRYFPRDSYHKTIKQQK